MWCFTRMRDFTWWVSDCEELVGAVTGDDGQTKKKYGENEEYMFHLVSYKCISITLLIPRLGGVLQECGKVVEGV